MRGSNLNKVLESPGAATSSSSTASGQAASRPASCASPAGWLQNPANSWFSAPIEVRLCFRHGKTRIRQRLYRCDSKIITSELTFVTKQEYIS